MFILITYTTLVGLLCWVMAPTRQAHFRFSVSWNH
jgi:hypothetical protein